ncbi:CPBP family intramembrane glutamic endopeptidase [Myroides marinus]|uniref:CPBP family intramembrane glutamic endopeptidase n=1 Tax=Myroides marinus TaxID=703342 RepID=UPI0025780EED|nr:CPBP family intramembrane glutamic endopeptidase [Myroides marinus]
MFFVVAIYGAGFAFRTIDVFTIGILALFIYKYKDDRISLKTRCSVLNCGLIIVSAVSLAFLGNAIYARGDEFSVVMQQRYEYSVFRLFGLFILTPIVEELLYRKYWFRFLTENNKKIGSIIIISLVFSATHFFGEVPLIIPFLSSIFLFWIYNKTQNIGLCILWHIIFNISSFYSPVFFTIGNMENIKIISLLVSLGALLLLFFSFKREK